MNTVSLTLFYPHGFYLNKMGVNLLYVTRPFTYGSMEFLNILIIVFIGKIRGLLNNGEKTGILIV